MYVFGLNYRGFAAGTHLQRAALSELLNASQLRKQPNATQTAGCISKPQRQLLKAAFKDDREKEIYISQHRLFLRYPPVQLILLTPGSRGVNFFPSSHTV